MRDGVEQVSLCMDQCSKMFNHGIEIYRQRSEFIMTSGNCRGGLGAEVALHDPSSSLLDTLNRRSDVVCEPEAKQSDRKQHAYTHRKFWPTNASQESPNRGST